MAMPRTHLSTFPRSSSFGRVPSHSCDSHKQRRRDLTASHNGNSSPPATFRSGGGPTSHDDPQVRFEALPQGRRALVRFGEHEPYGQIRGLRFVRGVPLWEPMPALHVAVTRTETIRRHRADGVTVVKRHFHLLFDFLDRIGDGVLDRVTFQDGLPVFWQSGDRSGTA